MSVRAFKPTPYEPPAFVAWDTDELEEMIGEIIPGPQCENCCNSCYLLKRVGYGSPRPFYGVSAFCHADLYAERSEGCGRGYPVSIWEEEEVTF